ncbi:UDP-2,3-diacylglucosamine diphosphatase [Aliamphritea spongicola]|uniref:UDP-2,3-diacylglucosamine diphosphatase n=1 Tax=Aliamphritea spongicola TaxID=707589 RepID=UPI00196AF341|nr:UDP-2,3-diacylglucosamine diphosphatase [Aliamphritea spongicola]MBN3561361.1 UDP-2,3-diacylglucosamine diphosphatase [Aliamphritea spongicola]
MRCLFISDLHLQASRPDLTRALLTFLNNEASQCQQLYILGDLFEAWIGDDAIPPDMQPVITALRNLHDQGTQLFFQHGNRDFLVQQTFAELTGCTLLPEAITVNLPAGRALLMHGDQLCTDDYEYMEFRKLLRNPQWQNDFLSKSIAERLEVARQLRAASQSKNAEKSMTIMDVNPQAVTQAMTDADVSLLIHGHTHRPAVHEDTQDLRRIVLGDWDTQGWYLECTEAGESLISFPITDT